MRARSCAQPGFAADLKAKVAANPELYKTIEAKIAEVRVRAPAGLPRRLLKPRLSHGRLTNPASAPLLTRPRVSALALQQAADREQQGEPFAQRLIRPPLCVLAAPHSCKYTQEGSVAYYVVGHIARADRRMKMLADVDVTPTAAQKAEWEADAEEWSKDTLKAAMASQSVTPDQMKEMGL